MIKKDGLVRVQESKHSIVSLIASLQSDFISEIQTVQEQLKEIEGVKQNLVSQIQQLQTNNKELLEEIRDGKAKIRSLNLKLSSECVQKNVLEMEVQTIRHQLSELNSQLQMIHEGNKEGMDIADQVTNEEKTKFNQRILDLENKLENQSKELIRGKGTSRLLDQKVQVFSILLDRVFHALPHAKLLFALINNENRLPLDDFLAGEEKRTHSYFLRALKELQGARVIDFDENSRVLTMIDPLTKEANSSQKESNSKD